MTITGNVPEGSQIILKIISPHKEFKLNKSGKGLGFIWLPIAHAEVKNIPGMYALLSSAKISDILSPEEQKNVQISSDFHEIYQQASIHFKDEPKQEEADAFKKEFISGLIKILKDGKLFQVAEDVAISSGKFTARLIHPADAPLGTYKVLCYAVKDGKAQPLAEGGFSVKSIGLAEWLSQQANKNGTMYGILAAFIAIATGVFVGLIFKKGGGH